MKKAETAIFIEEIANTQYNNESHPKGDHDITCAHKEDCENQHAADPWILKELFLAFADFHGDETTAQVQ